MDLGAYMQMEELEKYLEKYQINVLRLRGLRLMKEENKFTEEEIKEAYTSDILYSVKNYIEQGSNSMWCSWKEDSKKNCFIYDNNKNIVGFHLDKIHGKKKNYIKLLIKHTKKRYEEQYTLWNNMVGKDVLYVHARIGAGNWDWCKGAELTRHPRYLGHIEDAFDSTYCDLYFDIRDNNI